MRAPLLALVLLAPLATAHLEDYSQAKPLVLGPYNGLVEPYPSPAFENTAVTLRAIFSRTATGAYVNEKDVRATAAITYPDGRNESRPLENDGTGYFVAYFVVRDAGPHRVRVALEDAQGRHENETTLDVYPDVGVRIRPADLDVPDPLVGRAYPIRILAVDNVTLEPSPRILDLTARVEHWTDDHLTLLGQEEVPLQRVGTGRFEADHSFPAKGMFHLRFASSSGGFTYDEVPLLHVYATDPPPGSEPKKETPLAAAVALLALVLVALARRR